MKISSLKGCALFSCVAAAMLAGCGGSRPPISAPGAMPQTSTFATRGAQRSLFGTLASDSAKRGIYASENLSSGADVFGYPISNRNNGAPICSENTKTTYDIAVDGDGNLIVPNSYDTITVFKGPNMCRKELGSFHTIWGGDYPADATSPDAVTGTIAVGVVQDDATGVGSIELCTLKSGCKTNLINGYKMNLVFAVAMSKKGDCWASSAEPTALTYFNGCSGSGRSATGYENSDAGGLDIDKDGNLVSIGCSEARAC
jgi:hypothetical protein